MSLQLVLASSNQGKIRELQHLLTDFAIELTPQAQFNVPAAEETGLTFVENAIIKARQACEQTELPALADDSGIEVDALNGAPGVFSARYAGLAADPVANRRKLLREMQNIPEPQRTARFQCVLAMLRYPTDPSPIICQASWEGRILLAEQGENGFGYDPLFYVPSHHCSAAELTDAVKNQISHRAKALKQLVSALQELNKP